MCHEYSYIDFSQFSSALILGKAGDNDLYSNGVGKTTIFKAIEYVLFNQADVNLEKIIRDDADFSKISLDFSVEDTLYRVVRNRTRKGSTDLSLYERNGVEESTGTYHKLVYSGIYSATTSDKYWKDISGRRAADTEKDLGKLLKINFKSFRSTVHFLQNDFSGLTTATPEKRKSILKEALNLAVYSKLEKIAKDKSNALSKEIDKHKTLIENLGDPDKDISSIHEEISKIDSIISTKSNELSEVKASVESQSELISKLKSEHSSLESKFSSLIIKEKSLSSEIDKLQEVVNDYSSKKNNMIKSANDLISELKLLKEEHANLSKIDYAQIEVLNEELSLKKDSVSSFNAAMQSSLLKIEELQVPFPEDSKCKHCRQDLTEEHKAISLKEINKELKLNQDLILKLKKDISSLNIEVAQYQQNIKALNASKQKLDALSIKIDMKNKEIADKKDLYEEYVSLLKNNQASLKDKVKELDSLKEEIKSSSKEESDNLAKKIEDEVLKLKNLNDKALSLNKEITSNSNIKAIMSHNVSQKNKDKESKLSLESSLNTLYNTYSMYPSVLQAFSSVGIPNLIIQNVLDDLQVEANELLNQLKPSLQLSFFVEKTKTDGTEADTLDINYFLNGKERQYEQLSGAQKLAVTFSLKLGLSFLLQKMIGTDIKFLLLDEIDQSLDKASVDAFADIVKFFQKDFTILIITHNDRLKDKFKHIVLVEQDSNMISRAQVYNN